MKPLPFKSLISKWWVYKKNVGNTFSLAVLEIDSQLTSETMFTVKFV